jgi:hypothetical protein
MRSLTVAQRSKPQRINFMKGKCPRNKTRINLCAQLFKKSRHNALADPKVLDAFSASVPMQPCLPSKIIMMISICIYIYMCYIYIYRWFIQGLAWLFVYAHQYRWCCIVMLNFLRVSFSICSSTSASPLHPRSSPHFPGWNAKGGRVSREAAEGRWRWIPYREKKVN